MTHPVTRSAAPEPPRESSKAARAFRIYAALGPRRSYKKVLEVLVEEGHMSPNSLSHIAEWGKKHDWQRRVREYDAARIEASVPEWGVERILRAKARADQAGEGYDQSLDLFLQRVREGKIGSEALVQALKHFADIEQRDLDLVAAKPEQKPALGIQINIALDAPGGAAVPPRTLWVDPEVKVLAAPVESEED